MRVFIEVHIVSNPHALRVGLTHFRSLSRLPNACMKVLILTQISRFQESLVILKNSLQLLDRTTGENVNNDLLTIQVNSQMHSMVLLTQKSHT